MNNNIFWESIQEILADGFTREGIEKLDTMENYFPAGSSYLNDFHRKNSIAAQREALFMSLRPYSREQKLKQIEALKKSQVSKESSNTQRSRHQL